jgi:hypothetical protein
MEEFPVSDESNEQNSDPTEEVREARQRIRSVRHWRQRYAGPEGDYVFRKQIIVHGRDGKRRVELGEPVDIQRDGITPRRLKALWYSEAIELKSDSAPEKVPGKKTFVDNIAIALKEQELQAEEDRKLEEKRRLRRELNAQRREEEAQRRAAEKAVLAAEERERREMEELIAEEEVAKLKAKIDERLAACAKAQAEEAKREQERAEEEAQLQLEKAALAREREAQAKEEADAARAVRERESLERAMEREAKLDENRVHRDAPDPKPEEKSTTVTMSADEAKAALGD